MLLIKKWGIALIMISLSGAFFLAWQDYNKTSYMGSILSDIPSIDSVIVKDAQTGNQLIEFTRKDDLFSEMVDIYMLPYYDLTWSERKLLNDKSFITIDYSKDKEVQYTINVYHLKETDKDFLKNTHSNEDVKEYSYLYSPNNSNNTYIFALDKHNHLVGVNQGLQEIIKKVEAE